jgi:hypothetical protein
MESAVFQFAATFTAVLTVLGIILWLVERHYRRQDEMREFQKRIAAWKRLAELEGDA